MTQPKTDSSVSATVLVVDDEAEILTAVEDLLEDDYTVLKANSAAEGLRLLREHPGVSVVISDQRMPEMTGDKFLAEARRISDAEGILLTGYADMHAIVDAVNNGGIVGYLAKPWDPAALRAMVATTHQRCAMARELEVERALLHGLLEGTDAAVSFKDPEGRFLRLNRRKLEALGRAPEQCLGRREESFDADAASAEDDRAALEGGRQVVTVRQIPLDGGKWAHVETTRIPIRDRSGAVISLMVSEKDVTRSKEIEARLLQSEKMEALGTLTGGIAHDFNNLLTAIIGSLDFVDRYAGEESRIRRYVSTARQAAERGASLTRRLLSFSRPQHANKQVTDINALIAGAQDLLRPALGKGIAFRQKLEACSPLALIDSSQLELALLNLCVNARDAMPAGGTLTLSTANVQVEGDAGNLAAGRYVTICVEDTGEGMPPDVLARVFEPFFTTKEVGKGTGLGLAMVYSLVTQAGGDIGISSRQGEGTRIEIKLPLAGTPPEHPQDAGESPDPRPVSVS